MDALGTTAVFGRVKPLEQASFRPQRGWYATLIDDVSPIRSGIGSRRSRVRSCAA
jgi:hypothetical protein